MTIPNGYLGGTGLLAARLAWHMQLEKQGKEPTPEMRQAFDAGFMAARSARPERLNDILPTLPKVVRDYIAILERHQGESDA